jgi:hypothetical protein
LRSQSWKFFFASFRTSGGSPRKRLRKLAVVEDFIERDFRLSSVLFFETSK